MVHLNDRGYFAGKCAAIDCGLPIIRRNRRGRSPRFCCNACRVADCTGQFRLGANDPYRVRARAARWQEVVREWDLNEADYCDEVAGEILNRPLSGLVGD